MKTIIRVANLELSFTDDDVIDLNDVDCFEGNYNPHSERLWLLHDHGFTICVVQASSLQEAFDKAVNEDKLDRYLISEDDYSDYCEDGNIWDADGVTCLGNASEPFDVESLGYVELPLPRRSIVRLFGESIDVDPTKAHFA